jgi:hypothetical protein
MAGDPAWDWFCRWGMLPWEDGRIGALARARREVLLVGNSCVPRAAVKSLCAKSLRSKKRRARGMLFIIWCLSRVPSRGV